MAINYNKYTVFNIIIGADNRGGHNIYILCVKHCYWLLFPKETLIRTPTITQGSHPRTQLRIKYIDLSPVNENSLTN